MMSLGTTIDVALGLAFTYFLLALIASGIQEIVAGIFQWRGTYLAKGIDVILDSSSTAAFAWSGIGEFLRAHLTWMQPKAAVVATGPGAAAASPQALAALQRVLSVQSHPLVRGTPTGLPSYVSSRNFALALLEGLRDGSQAPLFSQAERTIATLPDGDLKKTLLVFMQNAGGDLDAFRVHIETWFDDAMDRLSGIYTRLSQYVMILLGVLLAVSLNVDSVRLARTLWQDSALRGQVAAVAAGLAAAGASPQQAASQLQGLALPMGWSAATEPAGTLGYGMAVFGWLFTALAIALGAPFWFGLVQQLTNIRSAGPKPDRSDASA